ncbi:hypothetical protein F2Q69_00007640 [Brassica cretica]|uniref:Uncharacterized protein n=1 Tax=Brassica cretica TaxID=69181 RepID=A0A8S9P2U2_BRACR|nr:hypothetical protein F2Q69_00007640 [Brassica cretica]
MICILERHILRNPLHPLLKSFKFLFVNFSPEVHIRMFVVDRYFVDVVDRYFVDVVDRYLVDVVDRHSQRKRFQLGLIALAQVLLQIADLSSLLSSSKLRSEMDFEFPSSCVHQDLINTSSSTFLNQGPSLPSTIYKKKIYNLKKKDSKFDLWIGGGRESLMAEEKSSL